jgi:hypothetical protein
MFECGLCRSVRPGTPPTERQIEHIADLRSRGQARSTDAPTIRDRYSKSWDATGKIAVRGTDVRCHYADVPNTAITNADTATRTLPPDPQRHPMITSISMRRGGARRRGGGGAAGARRRGGGAAARRWGGGAAVGNYQILVCRSCTCGARLRPMYPDLSPPQHHNCMIDEPRSPKGGTGRGYRHRGAPGPGRWTRHGSRAPRQPRGGRAPRHPRGAARCQERSGVSSS